MYPLDSMQGECLLPVFTNTCSHCHPGLHCGWEAGCLPEEVVTFTCTVIQGAIITWTAAPVLVDPTAVVFQSTTPSDNSRSCPSATVQCADLDYQATLTSVGALDMNGIADMTSTFRFTARAELNGTVVQCSAVTATTTPPANQTLNVVGE